MEEKLELFRNRLIEYRYRKIGQEISIHVNAMDITIALAEYAIKENRKIKKSELCWFEAGLQLEYIFGGSEWEDLLDYYDELYQDLKRKNLIEH